ncbi:MAG: undecaprenyl-diphosphate phosphatase [Defluviitaleaceae bacterium]|nr:undecaprenyl-diphosphate phosphatase [Defluviitaleaceae bacterium]
MTLFEAIILGIIQGLTEFLPVSSSGHLALGHMLFGIEDEGLLFYIVTHVATILSVIAVYWKDVWALIKRPFQKMTYLLIIATIPAAVVGIFFENMVEQALASIGFLVVGFIITGVVLMLSDRIRKNSKKTAEITYLDALLIGAAQAVAIFPGISRSGSTIAAALARGIAREDAAKFAFLMSIPAVLGGLVLQIIHIARGNLLVENISFLSLGAGFVAAALTGYLAVNLILTAIKKAKLSYFAYYVFALAVVITVGAIAFN